MTGADQARIARLAADTKQLGDTAKWLTAGLAGIGALLIAGLQLASLGGLDDTGRIVAAAAGTVVALAGLIGATLVTLRVLLPSRISLESLAAREREKPADPVIAWIHAHRGERVLRDQDDTLAKLAADYTKALAARRDALAANRRRPGDATRAEAQRCTEYAYGLNGIIAETLAEANHRQARRSWDVARLAVPFLALATLAGILALTWAVTAPADGTVDLRGADLSGELRGAELRGVVLDGVTLDGTDLTGTYLGEASQDKTVWSGVTCPDGTSSDAAGKTCAGHLTP